jgi:hypothetical protein
MADKAETATALMTALHDAFLEGPTLHFSADAKQRAANSMFGTTKFRQCKFLNHERLKSESSFRSAAAGAQRRARKRQCFGSPA